MAISGELQRWPDKREGGPKEPGETLRLDYRGLRPILRTAASVLDRLGSLRALADKDPLLSLGVRSPRPSLLLPWARSPP